MSQSHGKPELPYCRNCHFTLATPRPVHCGHCGQETDLHPPSVREMFTEYLGHYVAFDGPLWRTLWALICLPGHLTNAYFHGRRRRYVLPLRVYLSASFLLLIGLALVPQGPTQVIEADPDAINTAGKVTTIRVRPNMTPAEAAGKAKAIADGASAPAPASVTISSKFGDCDLAKPASCSTTERWLTQLVNKGESMTFEQWKARARSLAPYALLLMQPIFAALLLGAFAGSGRRYAEHFVFSLHSHSLWYLALPLAMATGLEAPMIFAVFWHGLTAMRCVYGLSWWGALWRGMLLSAFYFMLLLAMATAMIALIAATA